MLNRTRYDWTLYASSTTVFDKFDESLSFEKELSDNEVCSLVNLQNKINAISKKKKKSTKIPCSY